MAQQPPPWRNSIAGDRLAFSQGRQSESDHKFLQEISLPSSYSWAVIAIRAVIARACGVEPGMIHSDDCPDVLVNLMLWDENPTVWTRDFTIATFDACEFVHAFSDYCQDFLGVAIPKLTPRMIPAPFTLLGYNRFAKWLLRHNPVPNTFGVWAREAAKRICDAQPKGWQFDLEKQKQDRGEQGR